jgi:hypothetical protein
MTEFCGSSDYCNKCINNPNGGNRIMTESEIMQIKGALRKCAKENEGKTTYTGYVVISSVCNAAADRIEELEEQIEKMKCCYNCKHSRTEYEHCKTNKHEKWEIKENE